MLSVSLTLSLPVSLDAGLRIDHALISDALVPYCVNCVVDKTPRSNEQPSDHTPVIVQFDL